MAEQRQFLLDQARAPYALFLDDDLVLEPTVLAQMVRAITEEGCGFVGCAVQGLSYLDDYRPEEEAITFWDRPVQPEAIQPYSRLGALSPAQRGEPAARAATPGPDHRDAAHVPRGLGGRLRPLQHRANSVAQADSPSGKSSRPHACGEGCCSRSGA